MKHEAVRLMGRMCLALGLFALPLSGFADPIGPLALSSDGSSGALGSLYTGGPGMVWLNTDTGAYYLPSNGGDQVYAGSIAVTDVQQSNGSMAGVFNFSSVTVPQNDTLVLEGSLPAVILSQSSITIDGSLVVDSGQQAGGAAQPAYGSGGAAPGPNGGQLGTGVPGGYTCCAGGVPGYNTGSGGGGGGNGSVGHQGYAGALFPNTTGNGAGGTGGAATAPNLNVLAGGGGGASGIYGCTYASCYAGSAGGAGGGAVLLETPDDITIGSNGSITANGVVGQPAGISGGNSGAGGSGAGGEIWFAAGGAWVNDGTISAQGAASADRYGQDLTRDQTTYSWGGTGGGGMVLIDPPSSIVNDGTINVEDGTGAGGYGGVIDSFGQPITGNGPLLGAQDLPEPVGVTVFGLALAGLAAARRRRRVRG